MMLNVFCISRSPNTLVKEGTGRPPFSKAFTYHFVPIAFGFPIWQGLPYRRYHVLTMANTTNTYEKEFGMDNRPTPPSFDDDDDDDDDDDGDSTFCEQVFEQIPNI